MIRISPQDAKLMSKCRRSNGTFTKNRLNKSFTEGQYDAIMVKEDSTHQDLFHHQYKILFVKGIAKPLVMHDDEKHRYNIFLELTPKGEDAFLRFVGENPRPLCGSATVECECGNKTFSIMAKPRAIICTSCWEELPDESL